MERGKKNYREKRRLWSRRVPGGKTLFRKIVLIKRKRKKVRCRKSDHSYPLAAGVETCSARRRTGVGGLGEKSGQGEKLKQGDFVGKRVHSNPVRLRLKKSVKKETS